MGGGALDIAKGWADRDRAEQKLRAHVRALQGAGLRPALIARALDLIVMALIGDLQHFDDDLTDEELTVRYGDQRIADFQLADLVVFFAGKLEFARDPEGLGPELSASEERRVRQCRAYLEARFARLEAEGTRMIDRFLPAATVFADLVTAEKWTPAEGRRAFIRVALPRYERARREYAARMALLLSAPGAAADSVH